MLSSPRNSANVTKIMSLDQNDAMAILRKFAAQTAQAEIQEAHREQTKKHVRWLVGSNDYKNYNTFKSQTEKFKAAYWLAVLGLLALCYVDLLAYLTTASMSSGNGKSMEQFYSSSHTEQNRRKRNTGDFATSASNFFDSSFPILPPFVGSFLASTANPILHAAVAAFCVLFLLPWTMMGTWSSCDENPQEASMVSMAAMQSRSYFLFQAACFFLFGIKLDSMAPFVNGLSKQPFAASREALDRTVVAVVVPTAVMYLMFYRRFAKFWKRKDLVSHPLLFYAPKLGLALFCSFWFVSISWSSFSVDATIAMIKTSGFDVVRDVFFSSGNGKGSGSNNVEGSRRSLVEFSRKIYILLVPYCAVVVVSSLLPSLQRLIDFLSPTSASQWAAGLIGYCGAGVLLSWSGQLTLDVAGAIVAGIAFLLWRGFPTEEHDSRDE